MSKVDQEAHKNPLIVMVDEETGEKYARATGQKGLGEDNTMDWLIKDLSEELVAWGHPGGGSNPLILKSDGGPVAVRETLARCPGGRITPEGPPVVRDQDSVHRPGGPGVIWDQGGGYRCRAHHRGHQR